MQYQPALQTPLEFRSAPGVYQRMYRSVQPPYRLQSFNERLQRFRSITSSQLGTEEESAEQIINVDAQEGPPRFVIKRHGRNHSINRQDLSVYMNPTRSNTEELQIIPSDEWARHSSRYTQWQADEPEIVITSDVQLQTDESEPIYETRSRLERRRSTTDLHVSSTTYMRSQQYHQSFHGFPAQNTNTSTGGIYEPVPSTISDYRSSNNSYPSNYVTVSVTMDRATQIPPEPQEPIEIIDLDPEIIDLVSDSDDDIIDLTSVSSDKSDNEEDTIPVMKRKLYARPAPMPNLPASTVASRQAANSVIKHARNNKTLNEKALHCPNCDLIPILPVTGHCGHTRCTKCIQNNGSCPCGAEAPKSLHANTVIQYLIGKMLPNDLSRRGHPSSMRRSELSDDTMPGSSAGRKDFKRKLSAKRTHSSTRLGRSLLSMKIRAAMADINVRMPLAPQIQFEHARLLLSRGLYRDAAPHFARVAVSSDPLSHTARSLLSQIIVVLADGRDPRRITRDLFKAVRLQSAASWLRASDLECGLCYHAFTKPVTTPCGHTYCRTCIERALDYRKVCSLCMRPLDDFDLTTTHDTLFVSAALEAIDESRPTLPPDPNVIPIFVCTVAYPAIPCPLFIFDPRYWLMIRRVLESGTRRFGMVAYERDRNYSNYGTVLQVCDCVQLEDGRSFLSTVGVSRFMVIERDVRDGCDVARIQPLIDIMPTEPIATLDIRLLGSQILYKAVMWLNAMNKTVRSEIESAFGQIPRFDRMQDAWWESPDGPAWLWWLVAILPLRSEIKVLILSTKNLLKRMMAVSRTLEAIDQVTITTTSTSECEIRSALTNAEEWLQRGS